MRVFPIYDQRDIVLVHRALTLNKNIREAELFNIGCHCGLRISDLLNLKFSDIVGENITIKEVKTQKYKEVSLNEQIKKSVEVLKNWYSQKFNIEPTYLFQATSRNLGGKIKPVSQQHVLIKFKESAEMVQIKDNFGTHTLRKTFGYHHYKHNKDLSLLQTMFNHASQGITLLYIGITHEQMRESSHGVNFGVH